MSLVFHFYYILGSTSWIWTDPSTEELKSGSPSNWNSYESFNLEHWAITKDTENPRTCPLTQPMTWYDMICMCVCVFLQSLWDELRTVTKNKLHHIRHFPPLGRGPGNPVPKSLPWRPNPWEFYNSTTWWVPPLGSRRIPVGGLIKQLIMAL